MIKNTLKRNEAAAANADALAVLHENFAGCFTKEGAFDLKAFTARIRDKVAVTEEGYQLDFLGKNYARLLANEETETVTGYMVRSIMVDEETDTELTKDEILQVTKEHPELKLW